MRQFKQIRATQRDHPVFGPQVYVPKGSEPQVFGSKYEVREYGNGDGDESPPSYGHACRSELRDVEAALEGGGGEVLRCWD